MDNPYANHLWRQKNWPKDLPEKLRFTYEGLPLSGYLRKHSENFPNRDALILYDNAISYRELNDWSNSFAQFLLASGIGKGDAVAIFIPTSPAYVIAYMGVSKVGAIATACSPAFKDIELEYQLKDSGAKILVCLDHYLGVVEAIRDKVALEKLVVTGFRDFSKPESIDQAPEHIAAQRTYARESVELLDIIKDYEPIEPEIEIDLKNDIALMQYTGGTTGMPKGALHTYFNVIYKAACRAQIMFTDMQDRIKDIVTVQMAPIYHIAGLLQLNCNLYQGITQVMLPHFTAQQALQAIAKYRPQYLSTVTKMNTAMMEEPNSDQYDLTSIEKNTITSVGLPLTPQIVEDWSKRIAPGSKVMETAYGLTESHTGDTFMPMDRPAKFGPLGEICCGIPTFGTELKIVSMEDRSQILPLGERGEIAIKGPANFVGYWNNPQETEDTLIDGWLYTGDSGKFDEEGYFYWLGRKKEMIKVSGYSVFPDEVEMFLNTHPAVDCTGVTSMPDEDKGYIIKAVVVLKDAFKGQIKPEEIIAWSKKKMSFYKVPKVLEIRDALPRSGGTNKILRRLLK